MEKRGLKLMRAFHKKADADIGKEHNNKTDYVQISDPLFLPFLNKPCMKDAGIIYPDD